MILGIDPTVDYAFKHLLGRESTRPILISVVDSVLNPAPGLHIKEIELLNPFNPKETLDDKLSILDIKARDQSGRQFNIEMQMLAYRYYEKRILYYGCKLHQQQLHEGEDYLRLKPTISISFLKHVLFPQVADYRLRFRLLEESHAFPFTDDLEVHTLELPKFKKSAAELETDLDIWLYFLRHAGKMDPDALPAALQQHPLARRAVEELKMLAQTDLERERYEARRKAQLDYNTGLKVAHMEGKEEGLAEGQMQRIVARKEGREEGVAEGLEEGVAKGQIHLIHFCERLLHRPETSTEQLTGLSLQDLTRLADELQAQVIKQR
jgi:predicted transposase/invertase (TIGR01784 family)